MEQQTFAVNIITLAPSLAFWSGITTLIVEQLKPYLITPLNLTDPHYAVVLRFFSALVGVLIAGLFGAGNLFTGVSLYGQEIPPLLGAILTGASLSMGSAAWHEIGERLNMSQINVSASDSNVAVGGEDTESVSASSAPMPSRR